MPLFLGGRPAKFLNSLTLPVLKIKGFLLPGK